MTISTNPFWYKLITSLKTKREITNGVTIPYLLGAKTLVDKSYEIDDDSIKELLNEIINSSVEQVAVLQKCDDINQYVIGLRDRQFAESYLKAEFCFSNTNSDKTLCVTNNASALGKTLDEISEKLKKLYFKDLTKENFSWNSFDEVWRQFNDCERELITQA